MSSDSSRWFLGDSEYGIFRSVLIFLNLRLRPCSPVVVRMERESFETASQPTCVVLFVDWAVLFGEAIMVMGHGEDEHESS